MSRTQNIETETLYIHMGSMYTKGGPGCRAVTQGYRGGGPARGLKKFTIFGCKHNFLASVKGGYL